MDNFTIYKEGKYDIKANAVMKLEDITGSLTNASINKIKNLGSFMVAADDYLFHKMGK